MGKKILIHQEIVDELWNIQTGNDLLIKLFNEEMKKNNKKKDKILIKWHHWNQSNQIWEGDQKG
jgi:hypothetical protein